MYLYFREPFLCICLFREPATCICKAGWQGPTCNECAPYPECNTNNTITAGACKKPWECLCKEVGIIFFFINIYTKFINHSILSFNVCMYVCHTLFVSFNGLLVKFQVIQCRWQCPTHKGSLETFICQRRL